MRADFDDVHMAFLELIWGPGQLSPGGLEEAERILAGVDLAGKRVLDLGCGSGGITIALATTQKPARMTGYDIEQRAIDRAKRHLASASRDAAGRIAFIKGEAGLLPFADKAFDVVFSKDALVHVADKDAVFAEIARVLVPGGIFAAGDRMISHDGKPSADMAAFLATDGISSGVGSPERYRQAMERAALTDVTSTDNRAWYKTEAKNGLDRLSGPIRKQAVTLVGKDMVDGTIDALTAMLAVLDSGEHCPTHLRGVKKAN